MDHTPFDQLSDKALIRLRLITTWRLLPFSTSTLWRKVKRGEFPEPIKISESISAWRVGQIRHWLKDPSQYQKPRHEPLTQRGSHER